jgi:hypothetical protein
MKHIWILVLSLFIASAIFATSVTTVANSSSTSQFSSQRNSRYEVVAYQENFETGGTGWTHYDGAVAPSNWHIYNAGGTQGSVWWMGDPALASGANIGGYYDHSYLVLDTPQILVPSTRANLTFKLRYAVENIGTSAENPEYNGWDACNIRISTNNGVTWTVLTGTPAYNTSSAFSFGEIFGEGVNVAGWGGSATTWQNASFNLSAYAGQNVKIRFAMAADDAYSTGDSAGLFGMMVDDIALGAYTNNGVSDGQMTWSSLVPLGGDLWHIATLATAPSPTHVMACQNDQGSYNANMLDYLVSPPIVLPASGDIRADFMIYCNLTDPEYTASAPLSILDYFGFEISNNDGVTWHAMSNPYGLPAPPANNYVYISDMTDWASMTESFSLDGYISDYAGQTVKFRFYTKSDADAPDGLGFLMDDFKIYNDIFIAEPSNLTADVNGTNVELNWSLPGGGGEPGWLTYSSDVNADAIGLTTGGNMEVAAKWAPAGVNSILPYVGMNITSVKFWPNQAGVTYTIKIYTGAAGNNVYSQVVTNPVIGAWNEVILTTPFTIPSGSYVWVGYLCPHAAGEFPAGLDAGPAIAGFGDMYRTGTSWSSLFDASAGATDANWNIQAYVTDATGRAVMITPPTTRNDREITAYRVYRDDAQIAEVAATFTTYQDTNVPSGLHSYTVTAMYGVNESIHSNIATAYVLPTDYSEMSFDNGIANQGWNVGPSNMMAVLFRHDHVATIKYIKVFVSSVGTSFIIARVYDNNGVGGFPGTQHLTQVTYPLANIVEGWNYIPLPTTSDITIGDGSFYIALWEYAGAPAIGLDTETNGHTYVKDANGWALYTGGEVMIRAIVLNGAVGNDVEEITPVSMDTNNYPNPFNPQTSINYSVAKDGVTSLTIYNTKGQIVRSLLNSNVKAGSYKLTWDGKDNLGNSVTSGVYFYKLNNNQKTITKKMLLTK